MDPNNSCFCIGAENVPSHAEIMYFAFLLQSRQTKLFLATYCKFSLDVRVILLMITFEFIGFGVEEPLYVVGRLLHGLLVAVLGRRPQLLLHLLRATGQPRRADLQLGSCEENLSCQVDNSTNACTEE